MGRGWRLLPAALLMVCLLLSAGSMPVGAQTPILVPVTELPLTTPPSALTITSADRLIVLAAGDAGIYRLRPGQSPVRITALSFSPDALLLAPAFDYALTADGAVLTTLTLSPFNPRRGWEAIPLIDLPAAPRALTTADGWGAALLDDGYVLLELIAADTMNSRRIVTDTPITAVAVAENTLILAEQDTAALTLTPLSAGLTLGDSVRVPLAAPVQALAVSTGRGGPIGAALLINGDTLLFNPADGTILSQFPAPLPADQIAFADSAGLPVLVFAQRGGDQLGLVEAADPTAPVQMESFALSEPLTALAVRGHLVAAAGTDALHLYTFPAG